MSKPKQTKSKTDEERFLELWNRLDIEKVAEAIKHPALSDYDFEDAKMCVWAAAAKWLIRDLDVFSDSILVEYEKRINFSIEGEACEVKGIFDLWGNFKSISVHKQFENYEDSCFIIDWKTSRGSLDTAWRKRLIYSRQWRLYSAIVDARVFMYRGIQRSTKLGEEPDCKEIIIEVPRNNKIEVCQQTAQLLVQRARLIKNSYEFPIWPKNMPDACFQYGRECPYLVDCESNNVVNYIPDLGHPMSYSRLKTFQACPERHRRDLLAKSQDLTEDESDDTIFGSAVHRGLAELYTQAFIPF